MSEVINNSWAKETKKSILRDHPTHKNEKKKKLEYYFVNKKGNTIKQAICHMRQKIPKEQQKNKVYKFNCKDCKSWYIGETGQKMENRTYQHKNDIRMEKRPMQSSCICKETTTIRLNGKPHI